MQSRRQTQACRDEAHAARLRAQPGVARDHGEAAGRAAPRSSAPASRLPGAAWPPGCRRSGAARASRCPWRRAPTSAWPPCQRLLAVDVERGAADAPLAAAPAAAPSRRRSRRATRSPGRRRGFMRASSAAPSSWRVCAFSTQWIDTASLCAQQRVQRRRSAARLRACLRSQMRVVGQHAHAEGAGHARHAAADAPQPTRPSVLPARSLASQRASGQAQPSACIACWIGLKRLNSAISSAKAPSATVSSA